MIKGGRFCKPNDQLSPLIEMKYFSTNFKAGGDGDHLFAILFFPLFILDSGLKISVEKVTGVGQL